MASMDYENENGRYDDEQRYDRDRSASPRGMKRDDSYRNERRRSASPGGRMDSRGPPASDSRAQEDRDSNAANTGSNLFVTGIHPRLSETDVSRMFSKYGEVENCSIMKDPHTQESRGFGFVKMVTGDQADAAKEGLQGEMIEGRTLSIEKARRARPRTPTPGRYFGPPKKEDRRGGRFDDRRGGGYGGRRDDRYEDRFDDRRGYGRRDDYGHRGVDRYASRRDDRYGGRDERRDDRRSDRDRDTGYYNRESRGYEAGGASEDRYSRR
ncbi:hypothetical protein MMC10_005530 [Thelotrema lepadinum]|nr:hypothetical protein [Thelotrema lepadinum]